MAVSAHCHTCEVCKLGLQPAAIFLYLSTTLDQRAGMHACMHNLVSLNHHPFLTDGHPCMHAILCPVPTHTQSQRAATARGLWVKKRLPRPTVIGFGALDGGRQGSQVRSVNTALPPAATTRSTLQLTGSSNGRTPRCLVALTLPPKEARPAHAAGCWPQVALWSGPEGSRCLRLPDWASGSVSAPCMHALLML